MGWNGTGQDGTERSKSKDALGWKQGGRRRRRRCYNFVYHRCGTSHSRGVRWNENSPKTRPVEQLVPPVLGAPNVGQNALSHFVPSRPTYQTVLKGTGGVRECV
ncbi:UDP-glycosyltransferase 85A5-like [Pyrus ussuriensis x Pyrus communis]|uniref:UDP-glycosyltransferase 85A5-like n=1 Tax=Pyrus ussuriensis x Pyrus communis TaxID=2448454 RepID=A0A5N5GK80_9ROSA|nr:UDP-glycosyltransferase 85A5-like [Pyrus ussuriensis x Pyrus communis]